MNIKKFRFDPAFPLFLHGADGNDGGGGDKAPQNQDNSDAVAAKVMGKVTALLSKNGEDATAALIEQVKKNHSLENAKNTAETKVNELKAQIMTEEQKAELEAYRAYGKPEDIAALKAKADEADVLKDDALFKEAASLAGFDADVLIDLAKKNDFKPEIKEIDGTDGKKVKAPFVGDKNLVDYVKATLPKYLPSLQVQTEQQQQSPSWLQQPSNGEDKAPANHANAAAAHDALYN